MTSVPVGLSCFATSRIESRQRAFAQRAASPTHLGDRADRRRSFERASSDRLRQLIRRSARSPVRGMSKRVTKDVVWASVKVQVGVPNLNYFCGKCATPCKLWNA